MPLIELSFYSLLLYLLLTALLFPLGYIAAHYLTPNLSERAKHLCSFGYSSLFYALLFCGLILLGLSNKQIAFILIAIIFGAAVLLLQKFRFAWLNREVIFIHSFLFLYLLLTLSISAFPTGNLQDIRVDNTMLLTGLPIDNLIPYNVSRYLVERINFNAVEVVPNWNATDRGPLAAIINAVIFVILNLQETALWLSSSPYLAFVYQTVISYLNLLSLLAVWLITAEYFGKRTALLAILFLSAAYFYFLNIQFSWPKFYMAYFLMCAVYLWQNAHSYKLAGIFSAAAALSHDSANFSAIALAALILISTALSRSGANSIKIRVIFSIKNLYYSALPAIGFIVFYLLTQSPWIAVKKFYAPPSPRLVYFHLFCYQGQNVEGFGFGGMLKQYLSENSIAKILEVRLANLIYPFDPRPIAEQLVALWQTPFAFFAKTGHLVFFQLINGIGIPLFLLFLIGCIAARNDKQFRSFTPFLIVTYLSLVVAAIISGCRNNTVNHVWAYMAFCVSVIPAAYLVSKARVWATLIAALGVGLNVTLAVFYVYYQSQVRPFLHGSNSYTYSALTLLILVVALPMLGLLLLRDKEVASK